MRGRADGFTLMELMTIVIILGILAVVAIPRMSTSEYRAMGFHDQAVAALRFAQKTAMSHRRQICVTFPDDHTLVLEIDTDKNSVCDTALLIPGTQSNQVVSGDPTNAKFNPTPAARNFAADGSSSDATIKIQGVDDIRIFGATGYVQ